MRYILALFLALCCASAQAGIHFTEQSGLTFYAHIQTNDTPTFIHIVVPEVASGVYDLTDGAIHTAGLTVASEISDFPFGYPFSVTIDSTSSANPKFQDVLNWDGENEAPQPVSTQGTVVSGGGISFTAFVGSFNPNPKIIDVVQGERKQITIAVSANPEFASATPAAITVTLRDVDGNLVTIANADITRVCEDIQFQIIRCVIPSASTESMSAGAVKIQVSFDSEKVQIPDMLRIVESL